MISEGAYAIVYLAWDFWLHRAVAIKEFLPAALVRRRPGSVAVELREDGDAAAYANGLKGYIAEARMLAHFDHHGLVKVYRFWEENGSAYMVMSYAEGPSLEATLTAAGGLQEEVDVRVWLRPVLDALSVMHGSRCYHQHIGPDNIILTANGPVLLDSATTERAVQPLDGRPGARLKTGYAAIEQYSDEARRNPGPWTDLYALAAVAYRAITGQQPPPAEARLEADTLTPLATLVGTRCTEGFALAIDAALSIRAEQRPRHDTAFRDLMGGIERPLPALSTFADIDLMAQPFMPPDRDGPRQVTVPMRAKALVAATAGLAGPVAQAAAEAAVTDSAEVAMDGEAPAARTSARGWRAAGLRIDRRGAALAVAGLLTSAAVLGWLGAGGSTPAGNSVNGTAASALGATADAGAAVVIAAKSPPVAHALPPLSTSRSASPLHETGTALRAAEPTGPSPVAPNAALLATVAALPSAGAVVPKATPKPGRGPGDGFERAPADENERRARCSDVLQEATLRRLTLAEGAFFKKECGR